jgi:hypothetical protein
MRLSCCLFKCADRRAMVCLGYLRAALAGMTPARSSCLPRLSNQTIGPQPARVDEFHPLGTENAIPRILIAGTSKKSAWNGR